MKKNLYLVTNRGQTAGYRSKRRKFRHAHPARKDGPEPVHSRYHRRIAPVHDRKKAA